MPIVNLSRNVKLNEEGVFNTGDPGAVATGGTFTVDLAVELSKIYGKSIRQGQNFKVKGIQTACRPVGNDYKEGLAHTTQFEYCPTTKHSRTAWNQLFRTWQKQKRLFAGATGSKVAYDDFELAYEPSLVNSRTSTIRQSGMGDTSLDDCSIYGSSSNSDITLEDFYESMRPVYPPSRYSWNNQIVKDSKYDSKFPIARKVFSSGNMSAAVSEAGEFPAVYLSAATSTDRLNEYPEPLNVLCGVIKGKIWVIPDDVTTQFPDNMIVEIAIWVESWTPLVTMPRRKSRKNRYGRMWRSNRRYSKGRRNRKR